MERLTEKELYMGDVTFRCGQYEKDCDGDCQDKSCGLLREVAKRIKEYEDLEEQGKLLKLPCTVGDTVYWVNDWFYDGKIWLNHENHITESKVSRFICDSEGIWIRLRNGEGIPVSEFNKTVFLTREEAEAALKELEREK